MGDAIGAGDLIAGTARGLAGAAKQGRFWGLFLHFFSSQITRTAEDLGAQGAEQAAKRELAGTIQGQMEKRAEAGIEEGKLEGQAAQKAGEKTLKSMTTVTGAAASQGANRSNAAQKQVAQKPVGVVKICYGDCSWN